jgi:Putative zinc- or iron-chelating domain
MKKLFTIPSVAPIRRPSYGAPPPPHPSGELTCDGCSHCCHYIALEIDKPIAKKDYDSLFWFLLHDGVSVYIDWSRRWFVQFDTTCNALTADERCGVYETRPQLCRDYTLEDCVRHNGDPPEKHVFRSPQDLQKFLDRRGVDWQWRRRPDRLVGAPHEKREVRQTRKRAHKPTTKTAPVG